METRVASATVIAAEAWWADVLATALCVGERPPALRARDDGSVLVVDEDGKGVAIDGGGGCVEASVQTVQSGTYRPLSRPLLLYPTTKLLARPEGLAFVEY